MLAARKQPLPDWYLEEPQLLPGEDVYLSAFFSLSTERQLGWSTGPIPDSKIFEYGERLGFDEAMIDLLRSVIRHLDKAFLDWTAEQREANRRSKK